MGLISSTRKQQAKRSIDRAHSAFDFFEAKRTNNVCNACVKYICRLEIDMECNVRGDTSTSVTRLVHLSISIPLMPLKCRAIENPSSYFQSPIYSHEIRFPPFSICTLCSFEFERHALMCQTTTELTFTRVLGLLSLQIILSALVTVQVTLDAVTIIQSSPASLHTPISFTQFCLITRESHPSSRYTIPKNKFNFHCTQQSRLVASERPHCVFTSAMQREHRTRCQHCRLYRAQPPIRIK